MVQRLFRALTAFARWVAYAGIVSLFGAMAVTIADIVLRSISRFVNLFADEPIGLAIVGVVDIVQLLVMAVAFLVIPLAFMRDAHVSVDIVTARLSDRLQHVAKGGAAGMGAVFLLIVLLTGLEQAANQIEYGDRTMTLGIPYWWFWTPMLLGCVLSVAATILLSVGHLIAGLFMGVSFGGIRHFPETAPEEE